MLCWSHLFEHLHAEVTSLLPFHSNAAFPPQTLIQLPIQLGFLDASFFSALSDFVA